MFLKPTYIIEDITTIDLDGLLAKGIRGFIFDLDNTIMAPHTGKLEPRIVDWLAQVKHKGFQCVVVSNNKKALYVKEAGELLMFPAIAQAAKPRRKALRQAVEMMSLNPNQVVVVGDRPLTDIWGGQRLGAHTILVDPLIKHQEIPLYKFLRKLERLSVRGTSHQENI
jgi:HAD superfamily phosphatase (TIGR01668 family)